MKKSYIFILACLLAVAFTSCEKAFMKPDESNDPVNVFEYLWTRVDQLYTYFDIKGVDWDSVHAVYRPMVYDEMSDDSLFSVCAAMLNTLRDGHTNLFSDFDVMRSDTISYWMSEYNCFDDNVILQHYLTLVYHQTGSIKHNAIRDGKVAYLRYSSFSSSITDDDLKYVVNRYKDCDGIILDLRQNGGGSVTNMYTLVSMFDCHGQPLFTSQHKAGTAHNDFTAPETSYAPSSSCLNEPYTKPVAVLIDRGSYSATSIFALCATTYPNMFCMGDTTGGGLGLPNGGELPNGWRYRLSVTRTLALDGRNYENGVPPDILLKFDPQAATQGRDNIIDSACAIIVGRF